MYNLFGYMPGWLKHNEFYWSLLGLIGALLHPWITLDIALAIGAIKYFSRYQKTG